MVSAGFSSLRARRRDFSLQAKARISDVVHRRHTPMIEELDQDLEILDLKEERDDEGPTVVDVSNDNSIDSTQEGGDDDDDSDATMTLSSSPSATATFFPTVTSFLESPSTHLTVSDPRITSAIWITGLPAKASSFSTSTTSYEPAAVGQQTQIPGGSHNDNDGPGGHGHNSSPRPDATRTKVAIAFGTIGAVGLIVALLWVGIIIRRRRHRHGKHEPNTRNYLSHMGQHLPLRANVHIPSIPRPPFSLVSPLVRFHKPVPSATPRRQVSNPSKPVYVRGHKYAPPNSRIRNTDPQAAGRMDGDKDKIVPKGWLDEKRHDPSYPLPLLDPESVQQASVRRSLVRWFKRSSKHHPLRLNPLYRKDSLASTTSKLTGGNPTSRIGSMASMSRTNTGYHTDSRQSVVAEGIGSGNMGILDEPPPMSDLGWQRLYTSDTTATPAPAKSGEDTVTAPPSVFTKEDARAYYKRNWAESSVAGNTERMSTMSSWTDSTMGTSTQGGPGRESIEQAGLSPPPGQANHSNSTRLTQTPARPLTMITTTGVGSTTGSPGTQTKTKEELYAVYEQM